jgi:hypothetical protein
MSLSVRVASTRRPGTTEGLGRLDSEPQMRVASVKMASQEPAGSPPQYPTGTPPLRPEPKPASQDERPAQ